MNRIGFGDWFSTDAGDEEAFYWDLTYYLDVTEQLQIVKAGVMTRAEIRKVLDATKDSKS